MNLRRALEEINERLLVVPDLNILLHDTESIRHTIQEFSRDLSVELELCFQVARMGGDLSTYRDNIANIVQENKDLLHQFNQIQEFLIQHQIITKETILEEQTLLQTFMSHWDLLNNHSDLVASLLAVLYLTAHKMKLCVSYMSKEEDE